MTKPSNNTWLLIAAVLLLGACSEDKSQKEVQEIALQTELATSGEAVAAKELKPAAPVGWCSFISPKEVSAALSEKLPLGPPKSLQDGCQYPVKFGLNDSDAILVAAQVIAFGEELPINQEELKAGLINIARKVAAKL